MSCQKHGEIVTSTGHMLPVYSRSFGYVAPPFFTSLISFSLQQVRRNDLARGQRSDGLLRVVTCPATGLKKGIKKHSRRPRERGLSLATAARLLKVCLAWQLQFRLLKDAFVKPVGFPSTPWLSKHRFLGLGVFSVEEIESPIHLDSPKRTVRWP